MHISTSKQEATQWVKCVYHARTPRSLPNNFGSPVVVKRYMQQTNWFQLFFKFHVPLFLDAAWARMSSLCPKRALRFPKTPCKWRQQNAPSPLEETQPPIWQSPSGNLWPTLGQSTTDFGDITDFEEIRHRLWGNPSPTLVKSATDFVKLRFQDKKSFWEKPGVSKKEANRWGVGRVNGSNLLTLMSKLFWGLC